MSGIVFMYFIIYFKQNLITDVLPLSTLTFSFSFPSSWIYNRIQKPKPDPSAFQASVIKSGQTSVFGPFKMDSGWEPPIVL